MKLGKIAKACIQQDYPECWMAYANILGLEVSYDETDDSVWIHGEVEEIHIHRNGTMDSTLPFTKEETVQQLIKLANIGKQ